MASNPWIALPHRPPYVLLQDRESIERFNRGRRQQHRVEMDILPEPFLGSRNAPVVLLNLNPGFTEDDRIWHRKAFFRALSRANLEHRPKPYPFYLLDPSHDAPGVKWWSQKLGPLIKLLGAGKVAASVSCLEFFPYHSRRFGHGALQVPSQAYGFELAREAIRRNAIIVLMRGRRWWHTAVPELSHYRRLYPLSSVQNVTISERNCGAAFQEIVRTIDSYKH